MKKLLFSALTAICLVATPVYAQSLSDVANQNKQEQTAVVETTVDANTKSSKTDDTIKVDKSQPDVINALSNAADFSQSNPVVNNIIAEASGPASIIYQLLAWGITSLIVFCVLIDLLFIAAPPIRGLLAGGVGATSATAGSATSGMNRARGPVGGGAPIVGASIGGAPVNPVADPTPVVPAGGNGFCLVSQEAINATTAVDPHTGRIASSMKLYWKSATIKLVVTPILLVLTLTGILQKIGFMLGSIIFNFLGSFLK